MKTKRRRRTCKDNRVGGKERKKINLLNTCVAKRESAAINLFCISRQHEKLLDF